MPEELLSRNQIDRFIRDEIESVPQLEALLLFWRGRPSEWTCDDLARQLYVSPETCGSILNHLTDRRLIVEVSNPQGSNYEKKYGLYLESPERRRLLASVDAMYRHELVRISKMIHANASPALREFARSFRFTKDR